MISLQKIFSAKSSFKIFVINKIFLEKSKDVVVIIHQLSQFVINAQI